MRFQDFFNLLPTEVHKKGKEFEHVTKWWLSKDPIWASQFKNIWLWNEFPKKSTRDVGIDLVAEDIDGGYWAIQCKAYDPSSSLKKADIDSFLSTSNRILYSNRILITTTKNIGANARETLATQEKPVKLVDWTRLCDSPVNWALFNSNKGATKAKPRDLRDHQKAALNKVVDGFAGSDRGQLIMACGSGKTLTALRIHEALESKITIVLVPSLTLLSQTLNDWLQDRRIEFKWLAVCSDDSVANDPQDNSKLIDFDFPATTKVPEVVTFLKSKGNKVIFSTYHSSPRLLAALQKVRKNVDLLICDEAHRLAGRSGKDFDSLLSRKAKVSKRLFMTATPRIYSQGIQKMLESSDLEILSMDDVKVFGKVFFTYTFSQAIKDEILTDYRVVVIGVDSREVNDLLNKRALVKAGVVETDAESLALHVALAKAIKQWNLRRLISFHSRVSKALKFGQDQKLINDWLPSTHKLAGNFNVETISSAMPTDKRRAILNVLKNIGETESSLVTNARCLTEGIDVPTLDGVVFVDPKSSQVDIIQAVGRAIRLGGSTKTHGTIVIPVFVSPKSAEKFNFDATNYKRIGDVLKALRAHDPQFGDEIDKLRTELGHKGSIEKTPEKIIWDLPVNIGKDFANEIQAITIELASSSWEFMYGLLLRFIDKYDHARPVVKEKFAGYWLGDWVVKQRKDYRLNNLTQDRILRLNQLGNGWSWDPINDDWDDNYKQLITYVKETGNSRVSSKGTSASLGRWISKQRKDYNKKQLSIERIKALKSVSNDWTWDPLEQDWNEKFELVKKFEKREGHTSIYVTHIEDGQNLGLWVHQQRSYFHKKRKKGKMTPDRKIKLESIKTWSWTPMDDNFESKINLIQKYVDSFGTSSVPISTNLEGIDLGKWVSHLRNNYRRGRLSEEIIKQIEIKFPDWSWAPMDEKWPRHFKVYKEYVKENNSSRIPTSFMYRGMNLGTWVSNQKSKYNKGILDNSYIMLLENLHSDWAWSLLDAVWDENYNSLQKYYEKRGNSNYPALKSKSGRIITEWIVTQRKANKRGKISADRKALLDAIKFRWDPLDPWEEGFENLLQFVKREGHALVHWKHIENGKVLGRWVSHQRANYKKGTLSKDKIHRLEKLPKWEWAPLDKR